jgi:hypothetical protein
MRPDYVDDKYARHEGLKLDFRDTEGWLLPLEFGWAPTPRGLPGSYKAGTCTTLRVAIISTMTSIISLERRPGTSRGSTRHGMAPTFHSSSN